MANLKALIPLDGTKLAESTLALLPFLKTLGVDKVELITVWESGWEGKEPLDGRDEKEMPELGERGHAFASAYLDSVRPRVIDLGLEVETTVRLGRPTDEILDAASEGVDLILIATHGRDGLERFRLGSTADKVIRGAKCPTLVIGPNVNTDLAPYTLKRVFAPLDGSAMAEAALPIAHWIAGQMGAELHLARVVSITPIAYDDSGLDMYPTDLLSAMEGASQLYLDRLARGVGDLSVSTALLVGQAGDELLRFVQENPMGLIVMASHGRTGVARAALGSVADRLLHGPSPVLIIRPAETIRSRLVEQAKSQRDAEATIASQSRGAENA